MNKITYSFIIPHHNSQKLLKRCLSTIPEREDIEIIVIDDNSKTEELPQQEREDETIIYIDAEHTKGAGHARNEGLKVAEGKWIVFADCDDFFHEGFIDVLDRYKDTDNDAVYYNADYVDSVTLEPITRHPIQALTYYEKYDGSKYYEDCIKYKNHAPWTKMVRNALIKEYNIFFEEVKKGNDVFFTYQVGYFARKVAVEPTKLYVYTFNKISISNGRKNSDAYITMLLRKAKRQEFYKFIGYSNWIKTNWKFWLKLIKNDGIRVFFQTVICYLKEKGEINKKKHVYVDSIKSRKSSKTDNK